MNEFQEARVIWSREVELLEGVTLSLSPVIRPDKPWTGRSTYELRIHSTAPTFTEAHEKRNKVCNRILDALTSHE